MSPYARRVDENHQVIRLALERRGWVTQDFSSIGRGVPDLVACKAGRTVWVEVKDGRKSKSRQKLTPDQEKFHARMKAAGAEVVTISTVEEAIAL